MNEPKPNKQPKRRPGLLRLRLPTRVERAKRRRDLGDLRLQFLLDAAYLSK